MLQLCVYVVSFENLDIRNRNSGSLIWSRPCHPGTTWVVLNHYSLEYNLGSLFYFNFFPGWHSLEYGYFWTTNIDHLLRA